MVVGGARLRRASPLGAHEVTGEFMSREEKLARTLVELADTLVADFDVVELLTLLTDRCVDVLPSVSAFASSLKLCRSR